MKATRCVLIALFVIIFAALSLGIAQAQSNPPASDDLLSCSPAPCVLPPTQASEEGNTEPVADATVVADPLNPAHLVLGSTDLHCYYESGEGMTGFHFSHDGGTTWKHMCIPNVYLAGRIFTSRGEPMVGIDRTGNTYIAASYAAEQWYVCYGGIGFQKSSDWVHWSKPAVALEVAANCARPGYSSMAIDTNPESPYVNSVYIASVPLGNTQQWGVVVSHSHDGGQTWEQLPVDGEQQWAAWDAYTSLAISKDGTLYVTWQHCPRKGANADCRNGTAYMAFSKSTDGGNRWSPPASMISVETNETSEDYLPNSNVGINNFARIAVDNSSGPYAGTLYVCMLNWTGTYLQLQVIHSTDGGNTWSQPVLVAPPSDTHDQFLPALSVSSTGVVGISWLDRRNDPANTKYQAFAAFSNDGGQSFLQNIQLTQAFSDPNVNGFRPDWIGDYSGNTWVGPNFIAAWADSSNGVNMQDVVGGIRLH